MYTDPGFMNIFMVHVKLEIDMQYERLFLPSTDETSTVKIF